MLWEYEGGELRWMGGSGLGFLVLCLSFVFVLDGAGESALFGVSRIYTRAGKRMMKD